MIVCLCHRISDHDIRRAVREGMDDFESLQDDTCLARNGGCCEDCARQVFDEARRACAAEHGVHPAAAVQVIHLHREPAHREPAAALA